MGIDDRDERVGEDGFGDGRCVVEIEDSEVAAVDVSAGIVGGVAIEGLRVARQVDRGGQNAGAISRTLSILSARSWTPARWFMI